VLSLAVEQTLNGLQLGVMLFLLAAGLTLIFGIMGVINIAHGSLYMVGAFLTAYTVSKTGSYVLALIAGIGGAAVAGMAMEAAVMRRLYARDHLDQVLATFGLSLCMNEVFSLIFGQRPLYVKIPPLLDGAIEIVPGVPYPIYRLAIVVVGLAVALGLYLLISHTRIGMLVRAGSTHRDIVRALGVDVRTLYTVVFGLGALLAGLAGLMAGPVYTVQVGMGEQILILTFVVVVIGGLGSIRGAFLAAMVVGLVDTALRAVVPPWLKTFMEASAADMLGGGLSSLGVYLLMAIVLLVKPKGLLPAHA
jgi:branched-chain amino acid transport system permease protein